MIHHLLSDHPVFVLCVLVALDLELIREALRMSNISIEKAAIWMQKDRRQLDRQLSGVEYLRVVDLDKLPLSFHQWHGFLKVSRVGLPSQVRRAIPIALGAYAARRMARMELTQNRKRELA